MKRLLHISDLHFGKVRPELLTPLIHLARDTDPDLVAVSGDLTQRARIEQFEDARAFLDRLPAPWLAVPGNHDTPLDNLFLRLFAPWRRYKKHITSDMSPVWQDDETLVMGFNTMSRLTWQRGRVSDRMLRLIEREMGAESERFTVAVLHHPLEQVAGVDKQISHGARRGLAALGAAGADIVLSGHLHTTRISPFSTQPGVLMVQAGTGLSTRMRGEENTVNLLSFDGDAVEVTRYAAAEEPVFRPAETATFVQDPDRGWHQTG